MNRYTPKMIANAIMAEDAGQETEWVKAADVSAAIKAAYTEGFCAGAYCFAESAKPYKYVEANWLQSESRDAASAPEERK